LKSFQGWRDSEKVVKILFEEMMLGLGIEQMAKILGELSPGELEIFEILLNPGLMDRLKKRREEARIELEQRISSVRQVNV